MSTVQPYADEQEAIAGDLLDQLREHPERTAHLSVRVGRHPYVRWNPDVGAYEIAERGHTGLEVEQTTKAALMHLFAENPVHLKPVAAATYASGRPGEANVWTAVDERHTDVTDITDSEGGESA